MGVTATPSIVIHPYDKRWPAEFATAEGLLHDALGDVAVRIDHIGSTSVPGLAAKDIIEFRSALPTSTTGGLCQPSSNSAPR